MQTTFCPYCMRLVMSDVCPHCGRDVNYPGNPMHLPVGTTLVGSRAYVVGACRGQGGFGVTYIALDTETNERVAIKEYFPTYCSGRNGNTTIQPYYGQEEPFLKGKERFLDEARMVQSLSDLGSVVKVSDFFEVNNTAYLVMEFLDGGSLKDHVEKHGKMDAQQLLRQLRPLMADMDAMHRRGVIHRDIAPDNIILQPDGTLKLIDFGAARSYLGEKSMSVVVKKGFAPVEQYMRSGMGAYTDVYALAASIYYCITGIVPPDSAERQFGEIGLRSPVELGAALTAEQEAALEHALQLQPKDRTQSVSQFLQELFTVKKKPAVAPPVKETVPQTPHQPKERAKPEPERPPKVEKEPKGKPALGKVLAITAAAAAVLILGIFVFGGLLTDRGQKPPEPQLQLPDYEYTPATEKPVQITESTMLPDTEPVAQKITLQVWGSREDQENENSFLPVACAQFDQAHPEWDIEFVFGVCSEGEASSIVTLDPASAADVYAYTNDQLSTLLQANAVAPLSGDALAQVLDANSVNMITSVSHDGRIYGVPYAGNTWFMYYDKSVYTEEDIRSLNAMMAKKPVAFPLTNSWYLPAFYFATGGTMYGDGTDAAAGINFGGENGAAATEYIVNALKAGTLIDDVGYSGIDGLRNGTVGAIFSGSWDEPNVAEALGDNFAAAQLPCITVNGAECQMMSFCGSKAYAVNPNAANLAAAQALAAWLGSAEMQALHYDLSDGKIIPCCPALLADERFSSNPVVTAQIATIANASRLQPWIPEMVNYWDKGQNMGRNLVDGRINAANAAEETEAWNKKLNDT